MDFSILKYVKKKEIVLSVIYRNYEKTGVKIL